MVIDSLPQLATLNDDERETLAMELLQSVRDRQRVEHVSPELVAALDERRAEFLEHPERTKPWAQVKADILAKYRER